LAALVQLSAPPSDSADAYDIYLLPPGEDPETCASWLRLRNRDGRYTLMFEELVTDGPFMISPRITFEARGSGDGQGGREGGGRHAAGWGQASASQEHAARAVQAGAAC
jgi:hypothetical protein